ncbi:hypothetical protein PN483_18570 [Nodularia spumigena CS-591/04]|uniref:hypothetical protein n=1 Tax=Nodularia spumigena TaxID=70799 RepID=UPI00232F17C8|nr:hypothetical protein [Nodularia spumigena]MDB9323961.1 hypothetical protein [Nodularia spumigena CS-591/07A]MDB9332462.1 hypothetical protein [Nodularia spumigena CS-591/04]MDB9361302.1 hypothetical protein [Nodularia spumigena CS-588/02]MDB9364873.1 hypothetical protein [Nodularia spumigena CS-588/02A10]
MKNQDYRLQTQRKNNQSFSSVSSRSPVPGIFETRPFVVQQKPQGNSQQPDLKVSLMQTERYGHHLQKIYPRTNHPTSKTLQAKLETGQQQHQQTSSQQLPIQQQLPNLPIASGLDFDNTGVFTDYEQFVGDRQAETRNELEQLRASQKPETYQGEGQGGDVRKITQDPRFATKYKLDRESDTKGTWGKIKAKMGKIPAEAVRTKVGKEKPGENFHERYEHRNETPREKAKRKVGENKAEIGMTVAGLIPGAGILTSSLRAKQEGDRQQNAADIGNNNPNPLASNIAKGLADDAGQQKVFQGINAGVSAVTAPLSLIPGLGTAGESGIKAGVKGANFIGQKGYAGSKSKDSEARQSSQMSDFQQVDTANQSLIGLGVKDPDFGRAMLTHLSEPALGEAGEMEGISKEIALNQEIHLGNQQASPDGIKDKFNNKVFGRTKTDIPTTKIKASADGLKGKMGMKKTIGEVVEEPNMKPSEVKRLAEQEKARLRQKEQMGEHLDALNQNQEKKWFEKSLF